MSQKLPVNEFKWIKDTLSPDKKNYKFIMLIKIYNEESDEGYILKEMLNVLKIYMIYIVIYHSHQREWKLISAKNLCGVYMIKTIMLSI